MNSLYTEDDQIVEYMAVVAEHISVPAAMASTYIKVARTGVDPEVDIMLMLKAIHGIAKNRKLDKIADCIKEAFIVSYDEFVSSQIAETQIPDDEDRWGYGTIR